MFVDDDWTGTSVGTDTDGAGMPVANWGITANGAAFGYDQFATIQDAIDAIAATGGTIYVYAGNYVQELNVNKSVTIKGAQATQDGRTGRVVVADESVIEASGPNSAAMIEISTAGVIIDGFTIDGSGYTRGVRINEVDGVVIRNNIVSGAERGVQYNGSLAGNTGGLVEFNRFEALDNTNSYSQGVVAFDASYASVMNNDMTGLDVGIFEQYFYQPNGGGNTTNVISGNNITAALLGYGTNERSAAAATTALSNNVYTIGVGGTGIQLFNIYKPGGIYAHE